MDSFAGNAAREIDIAELEAQKRAEVGADKKDGNIQETADEYAGRVINFKDIQAVRSREAFESITAAHPDKQPGIEDINNKYQPQIEEAASSGVEDIKKLAAKPEENIIHFPEQPAVESLTAEQPVENLAVEQPLEQTPMTERVKDVGALNEAYAEYDQQAGNKRGFLDFLHFLKTEKQQEKNNYFGLDYNEAADEYARHYDEKIAAEQADAWMKNEEEKNKVDIREDAAGVIRGETVANENLQRARYEFEDQYQATEAPEKVMAEFSAVPAAEHIFETKPDEKTDTKKDRAQLEAEHQAALVEFLAANNALETLEKQNPGFKIEQLADSGSKLSDELRTEAEQAINIFNTERDKLFAAADKLVKHGHNYSDMARYIIENWNNPVEEIKVRNYENALDMFVFFEKLLDVDIPTEDLGNMKTILRQRMWRWISGFKLETQTGQGEVVPFPGSEVENAAENLEQPQYTRVENLLSQTSLDRLVAEARANVEKSEANEDNPVKEIHAELEYLLAKTIHAKFDSDDNPVINTFYNEIGGADNELKFIKAAVKELLGEKSTEDEQVFKPVAGQAEIPEEYSLEDEEDEKLMGKKPVDSNGTKTGSTPPDSSTPPKEKPGKKPKGGAGGGRKTPEGPEKPPTDEIIKQQIENNAHPAAKRLKEKMMYFLDIVEKYRKKELLTTPREKERLAKQIQQMLTLLSVEAQGQDPKSIKDPLEALQEQIENLGGNGEEAGKKIIELCEKYLNDVFGVKKMNQLAESAELDSRMNVVDFVETADKNLDDRVVKVVSAGYQYADYYKKYQTTDYKIEFDKKVKDWEKKIKQLQDDKKYDEFTEEYKKYSAWTRSHAVYDGNEVRPFNVVVYKYSEELYQQEKNKKPEDNDNDEENENDVELTQEAQDLLDKIDSEGSIPAFVTKNLKKIAEDNDIKVTKDTTADEIIDKLREKQGTKPKKNPEPKPEPKKEPTESEKREKEKEIFNAILGWAETEVPIEEDLATETRTKEGTGKKANGKEEKQIEIKYNVLTGKTVGGNPSKFWDFLEKHGYLNDDLKTQMGMYKFLVGFNSFTASNKKILLRVDTGIINGAGAQSVRCSIKKKEIVPEEKKPEDTTKKDEKEKEGTKGPEKPPTKDADEIGKRVNESRKPEEPKKPEKELTEEEKEAYVEKAGELTEKWFEVKEKKKIKKEYEESNAKEIISRPPPVVTGAPEKWFNKVITGAKNVKNAVENAKVRVDNFLDLSGNVSLHLFSNWINMAFKEAVVFDPKTNEGKHYGILGKMGLKKMEFDEMKTAQDFGRIYDGLWRKYHLFWRDTYNEKIKALDTQLEELKKQASTDKNYTETKKLETKIGKLYGQYNVHEDKIINRHEARIHKRCKNVYDVIEATTVRLEQDVEPKLKKYKNIWKKGNNVLAAEIATLKDEQKKRVEDLAKEDNPREIIAAETEELLADKINKLNKITEQKEEAEINFQQADYALNGKSEISEGRSTTLKGEIADLVGQKTRLEADNKTNTSTKKTEKIREISDKIEKDRQELKDLELGCQNKSMEYRLANELLNGRKEVTDNKEQTLNDAIDKLGSEKQILETANFPAATPERTKKIKEISEEIERNRFELKALEHDYRVKALDYRSADELLNGREAATENNRDILTKSIAELTKQKDDLESINDKDSTPDRTAKLQEVSDELAKNRRDLKVLEDDYQIKALEYGKADELLNGRKEMTESKRDTLVKAIDELSIKKEELEEINQKNSTKEDSDRIKEISDEIATNRFKLKTLENDYNAKSLDFKKANDLLNSERPTIEAAITNFEARKVVLEQEEETGLKADPARIAELKTISNDLAKNRRRLKQLEDDRRVKLLKYTQAGYLLYDKQPAVKGLGERIKEENAELEIEKENLIAELRDSNVDIEKDDRLKKINDKIEANHRNLKEKEDDCHNKLLSYKQADYLLYENQPQVEGKRDVINREITELETKQEELKKKFEKLPLNGQIPDQLEEIANKIARKRLELKDAENARRDKYLDYQKINNELYDKQPAVEGKKVIIEREIAVLEIEQSRLEGELKKDPADAEKKNQLEKVEEKIAAYYHDIKFLEDDCRDKFLAYKQSYTFLNEKQPAIKGKKEINNEKIAELEEEQKKIRAEFKGKENPSGEKAERLKEIIKDMAGYLQEIKSMEMDCRTKKEKYAQKQARFDEIEPALQAEVTELEKMVYDLRWDWSPEDADKFIKKFTDLKYKEILEKELELQRNTAALNEVIEMEDLIYRRIRPWIALAMHYYMLGDFKPEEDKEVPGLLVRHALRKEREKDSTDIN